MIICIFEHFSPTFSSYLYVILIKFRNMLRKGLIRAFSQVDATGRMLQRELIGDVIQISLKYGAYHLSQSQAVKAELMRSILDSSNHLLLYFSNTHAKKMSDEFYNHSE